MASEDFVTPKENEDGDVVAGEVLPAPNLKTPVAAVELVEPALDVFCATPKLNEGIVVAAAPPAADEGPATPPNNPLTLTGARLNDSLTGSPASLISAIAASEGRKPARLSIVTTRKHAHSWQAAASRAAIMYAVAPGESRTVVEILYCGVPNFHQRHTFSELRRRLQRGRSK